MGYVYKNVYKDIIKIIQQKFVNFVQDYVKHV